MAKVEARIRERIRHVPAKHLTNVYADGCLMSGPTASETFIFTFYSNLIVIEHENLTETEKEGVYRVQPDPESTEVMREDQVRVSMSATTAEALYRILRDRFGGSDETQ